VFDQESAVKLVDASRCHFLVFGQVKKRTLDGKDYHVLETHGLVRHRPLPNEIRKQLGKEFSDLLPAQFLIDTKNDLIAFEFTSALVHHVARYIIGIAALISGDPRTALSLFSALQDEIGPSVQKHETLAEIRRRLPIRIRDCLITIGRWHFETWRETRETRQMESVREIGSNLLNLNPDDNEAHNLMAIALFVLDQNVGSATKHAKQARSRTYPVAQYSLAFLYVCSGNLRRGAKLYRQACRECPREVAFQVEEFICWSLERDPSQIELHYCLGLVNRYGKGDRAQALVDFKKFLELADPTTHADHVTLARGYVKELG